MSFPRAKIKRFNDVKVATPSPADYNVDLKQKLKLGVIPQQERFADCRSPPLSESGSTQSTPCFRTPTMIKRRPPVGSASRIKVTTLKLSDKESLNEKIVECKNKDTYIKELTEQLEDLKNQIFEVQCEKEAVFKEKEKFESEIADWKATHSLEIEFLCQKHESEISDLNSKITELESDLKLLQSNIDLLIEERDKDDIIKQEEISLYEKKLQDKNEILKQTLETLEKTQNEKETIEEKHKQEIILMRDKHLAELQSIEVKMLNNIHDMQMTMDEQKLQSQLNMKELENSYKKEIKSLKHSFNEEKELLVNQNSACIAQLEEKMNEIKIISEIQAAEKCTEYENYWKNRLESKEKESSEILKECQAISEYNIIQSEVEKNKYKSKFEEYSNKYKVLEKKYDDVYLKYRKLQSSYSEAQNKLYRLMKEVKEKEALKNQIQQLMIDKQTYKVTIMRCQDTIDILKDRLKESDQDVEQLKNEIFNNENKLLEYEHKFNIMSDELREVLALNETLEVKTESNLKVTQEEIFDLKKDLLAKVEQYKLTSEKKIVDCEIEINTLKDEREEHLKMLEKYQVLSLASKDLLSEAEKNFERLTSENCEQKGEIEMLKCKNEDLQCKLKDFTEEASTWRIEKKELDLKIDLLKNELKQMRKREREWLQTCTKVKDIETEHENYKKDQDFRIIELEKTISSLKDTCNVLRAENEDKSKTIEEQNALIAPFKDQLESYELEMKNLKCAKDHIENEAKDLGLKYAQILGHQNHKQKIKYMVNLKSKNEELSKTNINLESKLRLQEKMLEKLRKDNADLKKSTKKIAKYDDKENIGSPNRSFKCSSPGPLKNLN